MLALSDIVSSDDLTEVYEAFLSFLTSHGWEIHDQGPYKVSNQATSSLTPNVTTILKAPMSDAEEVYKYVNVTRYPTSATSCYILIGSYESWDNETHVGVNPCPNRAANTNTYYKMAVPVEINVSSIYLFASERYIVSFCKQSNSNIGNYCPCVMELSKDNDAEITGEYPRWSCFNLYELCYGEPSSSGGQVSANNGVYIPCVPRGINNVLEKIHNTSSGVTLLGNKYPDQPVMVSNPFDPNKVPVNNLLFCDPDPLYAHTRGRAYGIKLLQSKRGDLLDIIEIPCDEEGFFDKNGELVEHYIIPVPLSSSYSTKEGRIALPK